MVSKKGARRPSVAYFCMEFGLNEEFRIYSGGLGILAGDILKAAHDSKAPLVGVGILWRQGYLTQRVAEDGRLYDCFSEYSYPFLEDTKVKVSVCVRGRWIHLKVWKCTEFNNATLYLLDANLPENGDRLITGQLYGWFSEERIAQELILGVGGVRALQALGHKVDVYHFNDSHPLFAGVELIRSEMESSKCSFHDAWMSVKERVVFTTHTPVPAGNEVHDHGLLHYMGAYNGLTHGQMLELGGDPFNMTVAGLRLSRKANAVAELHGHTARKMWKHVEGGAPIITITNGVHNKSWQDDRIVAAFKKQKDLWEVHQQIKAEMIAQVKLRAGVELDPTKLVIGFARRAATYKRADLIFRDKKIIEPLLKNRTVQLIFSGKAHPNDLEGKAIVNSLIAMSKKYPQSVVFLENYDMAIGRFLTRGVDIWLNNPERPKEASGTSGMKAAMNGVLNFSVLDGWWPEGCKHGVNGWQIGDGYEGPKADLHDAKSLYKVLTEEVLPTYYDNPKKWTKMMTESIKMSTEKFSAQRMLEEYFEKLYK